MAPTVSRISRLFSSTINNPCNLPCDSCVKSHRCFNKRALMRPLPWWAWAVGAAIVSIPLFVNAKPYTFVPFIAGSNYRELSDEESSHIREILKTVGVRHPQSVKIIETGSVGPSTIGTNRRSGAVIFLPKTIVDLSNPDQWLTISGRDTSTGEQFTVYEGYVKDFKQEDRNKLLSQGALFPNPKEIEYIVGHEGSHILNSDNQQLGLLGVLGVALSHIGLKSFNVISHHMNWNRLPQIKTASWHTLLISGMVTFGVLGYGMHREKQADINSASKLENAKVAREFVEKKIHQNIVTHEDHWVTSSGNDLFEFQHPRLTTQLNYLSKLEKEQEESQRQ